MTIRGRPTAICCHITFLNQSLSTSLTIAIYAQLKLQSFFDLVLSKSYKKYKNGKCNNMVIVLFVSFVGSQTNQLHPVLDWLHENTISLTVFH